MIVSKRVGIAMLVIVGVLLIGGAYYCVRHSDDDVLFVDWIATASCAEVWLFLWGAILCGVATGRQIGGK